MKKTDRIYIAGHRGMVGSAIWRALQQQGFTCLIGRSHNELDLTCQAAVHDLFKREKPDHVIIAAAKVGGIQANNNMPADFIYLNLMIETNLIHSAYCFNVTRLLFLGSSCIYPRMAEQPMEESALMSGPLEPTNEPYAVAKIAGIKLCESYNRQYGTDFRSIMPTNLYGPGDNFNQDSSHVIPALMARFHKAKIQNKKKVVVWGTGNAKREFLYVEDMAKACIDIMMVDKNIYETYTKPMCSHMNVGSGAEYTIRELAEIIAKITGFSGKIEFDPTKPDGTPRKLLNISKITSLGYSPSFSLEEGLTKTYYWYKNNFPKLL